MAAAAIGAGASILGSVLGGKGAKAAAQIQAKQQAAALAQQQAQFAQTQQNIAPYLSAGNAGLTGEQTLLGLKGNDAQQAAITGIQAGPEFTSQYGAGLDAILQNAAATGGLRGGNAALSQSNFGAGLLNQLIQQRLSDYSSLGSQGAQAAGNLGSLGQANSNAQSGIYSNIGNANATAAAAPYAAFASGISGIGQNAQGIINAFGGRTAANQAFTNNFSPFQSFYDNMPLQGAATALSF